MKQTITAVRQAGQPEHQLTRGLTFAVIALAVAYTAHLHAASWAPHLLFPNVWEFLAHVCAALFAAQLAFFGGWSLRVVNALLKHARVPQRHPLWQERLSSLQQARVASLASLLTGLVVLYNVVHPALFG